MAKLTPLVSIAFCVLLTSCDSEKGSVESSVEKTIEKTIEKKLETPDAKETKTVKGFVSFTVDGKPKKFDYLDGSKNFVSSVTTVVNAASGPDTEESFVLMLNQFDARQSTYPRDLQLTHYDPKKHKSPTDVIKAPKPLIRYTTADGQIFGSYVKMTVTSFDRGVLKGAKPSKFTDMTFEATLGEPVPKVLDKTLGTLGE